MADVAPIQRRVAQWDPVTGVPVVVTVPMVTVAQTKDVIHAAAAQLYDDPLGLEPEFAGLTLLEVMVTKWLRRAALTGDRDDIEMLLDRVLGRPKTTAENVAVQLGYEDYLKELERRTPMSPPPTASPASDEGEDLFG